METPSEPAAPPSSLDGFAALGLAPELLVTLTELGYEEPTPIQREAIPHLLAGRDVLGQAGTGTGKTAAFALPLLQALSAERPEPSRPEALVLVPTRELAMQVAEAVHRYGRGRRATVLPIYGGQSFAQQVRLLSRGVHVVVATPGRVLDHLERGTLDLAGVRRLVLDEADEMLDIGFADDLEAILTRTPKERQTALFSATVPARIQAIARKHLAEPVRIEIAAERLAAGEVPRVRQIAYVVPRAQKHATLGRVLDMEAPSSAIVFCRTRLEVDELAEAMSARGYRAEALHGGFPQAHRDRVMRRFRKGEADLLIATDVAARGLDVEHVSHVVNYDVPTDPDAYVHRIGRTGRAGREGVAITFAEPREHRLLRGIEKATRQKIAVETVPTVADLRARRIELTRATLREAIVAGGLDPFRGVVEELASEFDPMDVAAAAAKLVHEAERDGAELEEDEREIAPSPRGWRAGGAGHGRGERRERAAFDRGERRERAPFASAASEPSEAGESRPRTAARPPARGGARLPRGKGAASRRTPPGVREHDYVRLFVALGRDSGIRPADLVGAIANEAGVRGGEIGAIEIADRFSLVEVAAGRSQEVIRALRGTTIRGRKVKVRLDRR